MYLYSIKFYIFPYLDYLDLLLVSVAVVHHNQLPKRLDVHALIVEHQVLGLSLSPVHGRDPGIVRGGARPCDQCYNSKLW